MEQTDGGNMFGDNALKQTISQGLNWVTTSLLQHRTQRPGILLHVLVTSNRQTSGENTRCRKGKASHKFNHSIQCDMSKTESMASYAFVIAEKNPYIRE